MMPRFEIKEADMAGKDIIMISQEERKRLHLIHKILEGELKQVEATEILGLSYRHTNRIVNKVKDGGDREIAHKLRGKPSNRKIPQEMQERAIRLYREKYQGFGPLLASEKLLERDNIKITDETLRGWLLTSGDWETKRTKKAHRKWRERKTHYGEMLQMDGSHHDWFEGREDKCVLMAYIDDATSKVYARFFEYEGTMPAMEGFKGYIERYGLPLSMYADRHTTYKSNGKPTIEDELNNTEPLSEFGRALKELRVNLIHAHSPQAKGRIERFFETFQDRGIKEMRLQGISNPKEGNLFLESYLPVYNKRFSVEAREEKNLHRELPKDINLEGILCIKTERALRNDHTAAHHKKLYQIEDAVNTKKVIVEERMDGSIAITHKGRALTYKEITSRPERQDKKPKVLKVRKRYIPPKDHPWRSFTLGKPPYRYKQKELLEVDALNRTFLFWFDTCKGNVDIYIYFC